MKNRFFSIVNAIMRLSAIPVLLLLSSFCSFANGAHGQDVLSRKLSLSVSNKELRAVLKEVSKKTGARFLYSGEIIQAGRKVSITVRDISLSALLAQMLSPLQINFEIDKNGYIFLNAHSLASDIPPAGASDQMIQNAPPRKVYGKVMASDGKPIDGASVEVKGSGRGTATDKEGNFLLIIPETDSLLIITATGYEKQEIVMGKESGFIIRLKLLAKNMDEVVVIGYGEQKRKDVTGAIGSIKADDIKNVAQTGIDQMLQGRIAGVSVTQNSGEPGGGVSVRIRGVSTISAGGTEPLFVIDGVPIDGNQNNDILTMAGDGETKMSALSGLNPSDILSVDVLKDASAAAIYGNRAANGVVMITTKKGRLGEGKVIFNTYQGTQHASKYLDLLDLRGYAAYKNSIANFTGNAIQPEFADISLLGTGTDWQRAIFTPARMQNYDLAFSGGKAGSTYYVSGNYYKQEGTIIGSGFDRKSVRANMDNEVKPWLKIGLNATYSSTNQQVNLANTYTGVVAMAIQQSPDVPVYNSNGSFGGPDDKTGFGNVGIGNPVAQSKLWKTNLLRNKLMSDAYAQISFLGHFSLRTDFGNDNNYNTSSTFLPTYNWGTIANTLNNYTIQTSNAIFWNLRNVLTFHTNLNKQDITVMAGQEANKYTYDAITSSRSNFPSNDIASLGLGDPTTAGATEGKFENTQESFFARAIYSYDGRFAMTATLRRDQSSKFAPGHQIGYFPAVSAAWTLSREAFMHDLSSTVDLFKIRLGYGEVGNQNIPSYAWGSSLSSTFSNTSVGSGSVLTLSNYANPDLTWEHQQQWNLGIDVDLVNRVSLTVDLYNKISRGFLYQLSYPYYTGAPIQGVGVTPPYGNIGKMQNKGYDISVNYHSHPSAAFGWNSTLIFSHYLNQVKELSSENSSIITSINTGNTNITKTAPGQPIGQFYGYEVEGLFQTPKQLLSAPVQNGVPIDARTGMYLGDIQFKDINKSGTVNDSDRTYIGNPNPKFTFGFTNSISYKNFDLTVFLQGSYGNQVFNYTRVWGENMSGISGNQMASVNDRWTPENTNTKMPRYANADPNNNERVSDRFVEDGSYMRIENLALGYTFPAGLLKRTGFVNRLHIYVSAQNLYTFTKYTGLDPEIGSYNGNPLLTGVDVGRYPVPKTYTAGLNLEF
jgi:TonB-dependent starch-binding outer membrane protein SusC